MGSLLLFYQRQWAKVKPCFKSQLINLRKEGYWNQLMDEKRPEIVVKDWYSARFDCGCRYELTVRLLSKDYIVLEEFHPEPVVIEQWSDAMWREHPLLNTKGKEVLAVDNAEETVVP
ncbi:f-box only protein 6-like [Limosa lapponica baueri]|uniref:F-box only protein 6-like n=1 Tax=Limosa lapponica baueri TaxID=1758121 RepID=A0A2I0T0I3_LIMLA|nr:f-box only protein 6-like [Limosa lapponica baueri]